MIICVFDDIRWYLMAFDDIRWYSMAFNDAAVLGHNTKRNHGIMESWDHGLLVVCMLLFVLHCLLRWWTYEMDGWFDDCGAVYGFALCGHDWLWMLIARVEWLRFGWWLGGCVVVVDVVSQWLIIGRTCWFLCWCLFGVCCAFVRKKKETTDH